MIYLVYEKYSDAEQALINARFTKNFDTLPNTFKYNWEYGLVDAGIKTVKNGYIIIQRA